jgi:hypothetical protein
MQTQSLLNEYLSPAQLAAELDICTKTLDRWRAFGSGPPVTKIGRKSYYSRASVTAWLQAREQQNNLTRTQAAHRHAASA